MTRTLATLILIATLGLFAAAQDGRVSLPLTARESPQAASTQPDSEPTMAGSSSNLPLCPPKTCLYYAGDFDSTDSNANGLFNGNDTFDGLEAWAFVA